MTREEIIDGLEIYTVGRLNKDRVHITVEELQKFIDEIKTLEQETVLDKIRAEIDGLEINGHIRDVECFRAGINTVLNVIDKYMAERSDKA